MNNQSDALDYLWQIGYFKEFRSSKEISEKILLDFGIYCSNIIPILNQKRFKNKIRKLNEGWREIRPAAPTAITKKELEFEEIKGVLGDAFKREMEELEYVSINCPNCTAFLLRKILEKLLFITISKSDNQKNIENYKQKENRLPNLTELLNISKSAKINNVHIITPKNVEKLDGSKFLGDVSAHDYLTSVGFEDIKQEISIWRISIKELASNL